MNELERYACMYINLKWGKIVSNSRGIEVNNRTFWPRGPSSAVTLKYYRVLHSIGNEPLQYYMNLPIQVSLACL